MATVLFETTVMVDLVRGRTDAVLVIAEEQRTGHTPTISIVSSMELIVGCRDKAEVQRVEQTLVHFVHV